MSTFTHRILLSWFALGCAFAQSQTSQRITIDVVDETGVGIASALGQMTASGGAAPLQCRTGPTGTCILTLPGAGPYRARVEKENFYATESSDLRFDQSTTFEFTLGRQREVRELGDG